jgi:hypothetical protein
LRNEVNEKKRDIPSFMKTFSIVTRILKTIHYVPDALCFLLHVKPLILKHN